MAGLLFLNLPDLFEGQVQRIAVECSPIFQLFCHARIRGLMIRAW
jgi:hypothetical protein